MKTLHISYKNESNKRHLEVFRESDNSLVFTVDNNPGSLVSRAKLTVRAAGAPIGTAVFHTIFSRIDLSIGGKSQTMKQPWLSSSSYNLHSITGDQLQWRKVSGKSEFQLVHAKSEKEIGKITHLFFGQKHPGKLEFDDDQISSYQALVTALAVVEARRRSNVAWAEANAYEGAMGYAAIV
jgi:hypothetical protein